MMNFVDVVTYAVMKIYKGLCRIEMHTHRPIRDRDFKSSAQQPIESCD